MQSVSAVEPRAMCLRCMRPASVCYCRALPSLSTATRVVILQHPRERNMPIGTARMASLALRDSELYVGLHWGEHSKVRAALEDRERTPILLYPGPEAKDILAEPPQGPVTLVVVDGTWSQARVVVRENPILRALPRYAFRTPEPTHYRIRREPKDEYCSTIEALMHVLGALEGDPPKFRALLAPMHAMIDAQLEAYARARGRGARHAKKARGPRRPLSADILQRFGDLVVLVADASGWPYGGVERGPDELVHVVLHRLVTNETWARVIAPTSLSPTAPFHVQLSEDQLRAGGDRTEVMAELSSLLRPNDVVCTWGPYSIDRTRRAGAVLPNDALDVRERARAFAKSKIGTLETYATSHGPAPAPVADGRAGARAALLARILHAWRTLG
jgi:DTW domain-containing protein